MIVSRTPIRICLVGGGTDVPDFYRNSFGAVVTVALEPFIYVLLNPRPDGRIRLCCGVPEECDRATDLHNPLVREALALRDVGGGLDIAILSEVAPGTGLGWSSAMTVGLLHALDRHLGRDPAGLDTADAAKPPLAYLLALASDACQVEMELAGGNAGKLDQYSTAVGGVAHLRFDADERVQHTNLAVDEASLHELSRRLMLFDTGSAHSASVIMAGWRRSMADKHAALVRMRDQAAEAVSILRQGPIDSLGPLLHEAWQIKRTIADGITSPEIDTMYEMACRAGATGGKLCGAGGGGFLLVFAAPERTRAVRQAMSGYRELPVRLTRAGTEILIDDRSSGHRATT
jgi:D-glycero-alpha-D-manno-heptose-7-phosphate kinase